MKTVLVPTDFNVESLKIIDSLVITHKPEEIGIVFIHAFKLSDSITDMLMLSRRSRDYENVSDEFYTQLELYKQKYPNHIKFIGIDYFYGSSVAAFKNFIEAKDASCIAYPKDYNFTPLHKNSIDPSTLTKRCGCDVLELDITQFAGEEKLFETKMSEKRSSISA
ncbi:MAG: hypothetical protein V4546_15015 [Bacteroidota bacterium]|jgi:hypothetical protein|nr:MAG: hypothetical protein EOO47_17990 [Flavobacterium sp.]